MLTIQDRDDIAEMKFARQVLADCIAEIQRRSVEAAPSFASGLEAASIVLAEKSNDLCRKIIDALSE